MDLMCAQTRVFTNNPACHSRTGPPSAPSHPPTAAPCSSATTHHTARLTTDYVGPPLPWMAFRRSEPVATDRPDPFLPPTDGGRSYRFPSSKRRIKPVCHSCALGAHSSQDESEPPGNSRPACEIRKPESLGSTTKSEAVARGQRTLSNNLTVESVQQSPKGGSACSPMR